MRAAEEQAGLARIRERALATRRADSLGGVEGVRQRALAEWTGRVRSWVEAYWSLPESMKKTPRRAVARVRVASTGVILGVTWPEKSGSPEFDRLAARALTRAKRLPPFPPELGTEPLAIRYEFTTPGLQPPRRRLRVKDPGNAEVRSEKLEVRGERQE
jgi:TonB family protein